jgi:L-ascorbate metabolism protein UlaG (beta-lactamase superfamily)
MNLIMPVKQDKALASEIAEVRRRGIEDALDIWWLGQSGFLVQWNKRLVLFDPYLSDSLTKKYASTDKPHVRMSERVIQPELLNAIDVVTSSHNHTDHLDAETLIPIVNNNPDVNFIIPEANRSFVTERLQCKSNWPIGLNDSKHKTIHGITFHGVPAAHNDLERDEQGNCIYMGFVVKFGSFTVYHSGDTLWYEHMVEILQPFKIDIAFLPINGNIPSRRVAGNLNAEEAARLGKLIGARLVIPHHYDLFTFNTADPGEFIAAAENLHQPYKVLQLGERFTLASQ